MHTTDSPMGEQYELSGTYGGATQHAVVTQVGAALRRLVIDGVELLQDYPQQIAAPSCAGVVLVPWPNRVAAGTWDHEGTKEQLAITEPARGHAIHGLLRHSSYSLLSRTPQSVALGAEVSPAPGYPFELSTTVHYELQPAGVQVTHKMRNRGSISAPVAVGAHPYLRVGQTPVSDLVLVINAQRHMELDGLMIPTGMLPEVTGTAFDYRNGKKLGDAALDDAWTAIIPGPDGGSLHHLQAPDGSRVQLHMDANYGFLQAYTTKAFPGPDGPVHAVALEPMTAAANALNNGLGLRWLDPGESWESSWGISHEAA